MGKNKVRFWVFVVAGVLGCGFCVSVDPTNVIAWAFGLAALLAGLIVAGGRR